MDLVAIAILCQLYTPSTQLSCQKWYVNCWNQKRTEQLEHNKPYDGGRFLAECVLEKK